MGRDDADDGMLARWSRRKRAAAEAAADEEPRPEEPESQGEEKATLAEQEIANLSDAELAEKLGLPDPAKLAAGDSVKAFLAAGVPRRLRNVALRRMWHSNPALTALDELVDYAEDYTQAAAAAAISTSYEVGRGLKAHVEKEAEAAREAKAEQGSPAPQPAAAPSSEAAEPGRAGEETAEAAPAERDSGQTGQKEAQARTAPRRRMVFHTPRNPEDE